MSDISKISQDQVMDLINFDNGSSLTLQEVELGTPAVIDVGGKNTSVDVISLPNGGYTGTVNVTYNRLPLDGLLAYGAADIVVAEDTGLPGVVSGLNALFGTQLVIDHDVDSEIVIPPIDYEFQEINLPAMGSSLAYIGAIDVNVRLATTLLNTIIVNTDLYGLSFPPPTGILLDGTVTQLSNLPVQRYGSRAELVNGILYIIGGSLNSRGTANGDVMRYDVINDTFLTNGQSLINFIRNAASCVHGNNIHLMGGGSSDTTASAYHYIYNTITNEWSFSSGPYTLLLAAAVTVGNHIYLHGGRTTGGAASQALYRYDVLEGVWETMTPSPTGGSGDSLYGLFHKDGKIYSFPSRSNQGNVYIYDIITDSWTTQALTDNVPRDISNWPSSVVVSEIFYMFSGTGADSQVSYFDLDTFTIQPFAGLKLGYEAGVASDLAAFYVVGGTADNNGVIRVT